MAAMLQPWRKSGSYRSAKAARSAAMIELGCSLVSYTTLAAELDSTRVLAADAAQALVYTALASLRSLLAP